MATKIGEMLLKGNLITQEQLLTALDTQKRTRERIGSLLVKAGAIKEPELLSFLGRQFNIPVVELSKYEINPEVVRLLPEDMVQKNLALPINRVGAKLIVAVADPSNMAILDAIGFKTGYSVELVLASEMGRGVDDPPVVKLVNFVLTDAIKRRASDIHIEPYEKEFRVRYRIDGVLYEDRKSTRLNSSHT